MKILNFIKSSNIHTLFETGIIFKIIFGLFEIASGIGFYFVSQDFIVKILLALTQNELIEDPHDVVANYLFNASGHIFSGSQYFASFYLLSHGLVKIIVLIGLLKNKYWAYPTSIIVFGLFIVYQLYRFTITHSIWLLILTIIDVIVIWLVWKELKQVKIKNLKF